MIVLLGKEKGYRLTETEKKELKKELEYLQGIGGVLIRVGPYGENKVVPVTVMDCNRTDLAIIAGQSAIVLSNMYRHESPRVLTIKEVKISHVIKNLE